MEKMLRDKLVIALFILPALLLFVVFIPVPLISSLGLSFFKWNLLSPARFTGLNNFIRIITIDPVFIQSVGNTFQYLGFSILMQIPLAYFLAILLTRRDPGEKIFRNFIFMPVTFSGTAVALMFYFVYHRDTGLINNIIRFFSNTDFSFGWLSENNTAMLAVCIAVAWQFVGYHMVIYITGITGISEDIIDAAKIDGASSLQVAWHVITPLMKPVLNVSLVLITTSSLKAFDAIYVMTQGGPMHATEVMASHMYNRAFINLDYGYACAIGLMLFVLCILSTILWSKIFSTKDDTGSVS
ncbi:MAG: sugar ABC transporter permease [Treponema sp.]|jgi:raffinose/stachyose/melibiose transport system permease protein|nr:sugar ABC transporter permease [Treponema sp.]